MFQNSPPHYSSPQHRSSHRGRRLLVACALACVVLSSSGCAAVRGVLRPLVCECERTDADEVAQVDEEVHSEPDEGELEDHEEEGEDEGEDLASEDEALEPEDSERPQEGLAEAELAPIEVVVTEALVAPAEQQERARAYGISSLHEGSYLLTGDFARKPGPEAFVVVPQQEVAVYGASGRLARERLALDVHDAFPPATLAVVDPSHPVQAVALVQDGTQQVAVASVEPGHDGQRLVWLTILKPVGGRVGQIFRAPLARIVEGGYVSVGRVDFLRGRQHRALRYTPLDEGEASGWSEPRIFRWNRWEGMYRVPATPPTAPTTPRS